MDILPSSILTGPARSAAFVERNRQDQARVAQQNAVIDARMSALTAQGKSIVHAQQQQSRAAQIQQDIQRIQQNSAGDLSDNMYEIGSLEAALQESALLPSFVAAHPAIFTDSVLSLYSSARQTQIETPGQMQIKPITQPKK